MKRYIEKGNLINQMQPAGRPILFQASSIPISSQQCMSSIPVGGKKRFAMPQNEIDSYSIFTPPIDEFRPDNREYAQYNYDRNLITDDIEGACSGTRTSPVLKNILRAKELSEFNKNHPFSSQYTNYQQQYNQKPAMSQNNFQQQYYQKPGISHPAWPYQQQSQNLNSRSSFNCQNQQNQNPYHNEPQSAQLRAAQHILFNNQLIMNENPANEFGFQGFENIGKRSASVYKFGSGLKEMGLM